MTTDSASDHLTVASPRARPVPGRVEMATTPSGRPGTRDASPDFDFIELQGHLSMQRDTRGQPKKNHSQYIFQSLV